MIVDADELARAAERLADGSGPVAVDAERANGFRYSARAYLVQLHRRGAGTVLVDPTAFDDLSVLQEAIGGEEWIIHAASQDLPCLREVGLEPARLFDTELGARLAGFERVGLAAVTERLVGLRLRKEHGASDWSTRPIPESWLEYAALDVEVLPDARDALAAELREQGKQELAEQEFAYALERLPKPPAEEPWRRLSGVHTIRDRRQLAVARELWLARDELASSTDTAPGRLVPDRSLLAAATADLQSKSRLAARRDFSGRASRSELDRWWSAIERGRSTEDLPQLRVRSDEPPPPRFWKGRRPSADARLKAARAVVQQVAAELSMPAENLLMPDTLRRVAWEPTEPTADAVASVLRERDAREWQVAATAQRIAAAFVEADQAPAEPSDPDS
ncbi:HRDC domain-containing protein [Agrococcus sp. Marseille-P2731]|uniref:HRDC domain-containing protein n=1 Tax=Agrococcus sp. Marseille-P2731 TaxID=1841862 RepID=UPI0009311E8A|nr:HRDC domain-containing protein [Agrococcus sp. Marseille-P2731]